MTVKKIYVRSTKTILAMVLEVSMWLLGGLSLLVDILFGPI